MTRVVAHVDLDYFFAQLEELRNPTLKNKPIVVCVFSGRTPESGAVSTANYEARRYGVKSGIPIAQAKMLLKDVDAALLPMDKGYYEEVSDRIMEILRSYADAFEQVGIDEAFLELTKQVEGDFDRARDLALRIKDEIYARARVTCSIGVGPNKLLAKMASDFQKPNGLTVIRPEQVKGFLYPLPVGKLYGVGSKTEKKLQELGVRTIGDLAALDAEKLQRIFGKGLGLYFHRAANGIDDEPVQEREEREQISRMATLRQNTRDYELIAPELERLAEDVAMKVRGSNLAFRSIGIIAIMDDLTIHTRSRTVEGPTDDVKAIAEVSRDLLKKFLEELKDQEVRRIGVKVFNLTSKTGQTYLSQFVN